MVGNQFILNNLWHSFKRIECTSKVTCELWTGLDNFIHYFNSLSFCNSWSERISSQVSSNSNSSGIHHSWIFSREISINKLTCIHVRHMLSIDTMSMVLFYNFIKQFMERSVSIMRSCIKTDSRVKISNSRETTCLEWNSWFTAFIFILIPNFLSEISWKSRISVWLEESVDILERLCSCMMLPSVSILAMWLHFG